jgi:hypothetical protein
MWPGRHYLLFSTEANMSDFDRIFIQHLEGESDTWCDERLSEEDTEYIRADLCIRPGATESHEEQIICPECENEQTAVVEHTIPWFSYVHVCKFCDYVIMESEWQAPDKETAVS